MPAWFLYLQGFAMLLMGVGLLVTRPRKPGASLAASYLTPARLWGTLWALLCVAVGVGLLAMALGYVQLFPHPPAPGAPY